MHGYLDGIDEIIMHKKMYMQCQHTGSKGHGESALLQYIDRREIPKNFVFQCIEIKVQQLIMTKTTGSANSGIQSKYQLTNVNTQF